MKSPVVLLHGTNAGPWTMANFAEYFEKAGHICYCPSYRHHEDLKADGAAKALLGLSIADYVKDIAQFVERLEQPPIIVGHSLGGVVAQKIAALGLARAAVLINGSIVWGVLPTTDDERELGKLLMSSGQFWNSTLLPDFEIMCRYGLNMLPTSQQRDVFDRLGPESGQVMFELFFWMFDKNETTKIAHDRVRCPLLMITGTEDLAVPPSTARQIANRYGSLAKLHKAEGFGHYLMLEPRWREIAQYCSRWMADSVV
ncbi:MAG: alpha/beta hydrolase [Hyphomicrobiaceae bacterium]